MKTFYKLGEYTKKQINLIMMSARWNNTHLERALPEFDPPEARTALAEVVIRASDCCVFRWNLIMCLQLAYYLNILQWI